MEWYYFSGTGNSLAVARALAEAFDGTTFSMAEQLRHHVPACSSEMVGLAFPLYYGGLPEMVERFLQAADFSKARYIVAVVTKGGSPGGLALEQVRRILRRKEKDLNAGFYVLMPGNYICLYNAPPEERQRKMLARAEARIQDIVVSIRARLDYCQKEAFLPGLAWRFLYWRWRKKRSRKSLAFRVEAERCTSCGLCARLCPAGIISLKEGLPVWQEGCQECMACIQGCPSRAIQRGKKTESRRRYRHPGVTLTDLIPLGDEKEGA